MTVNPSDKAILKSFKNLKDQTVFSAALSKLRTVPSQDAFRELHDALLNEVPAAPLLESMAALLSARMINSVEFAFVKFESAITNLSIESVLRIAPTPKCLQLWVATGAKQPETGTKDRTSAAIERFRQSPVAAMESVLAHWFVCYAPVLSDSVPLFIAKIEERMFTSIEDILAQALRRDNNGKFTARLLTECDSHRDAQDRMLALVRNDSVLFDEFTRTFLIALKDLPIEVIRTVVKGLIGDLKLGRRLLGRELSRRLLWLAATALGVPASEQVHCVLDEIDRLSAELQNTVPEGQVDRDVCGARYHGRLRDASKATISAEAAKHLSITINKIRVGTDPVLALEATAFNLGMRAIQKVGETIAFNPSIHEDAVGGALRGETVLVVQVGWCLGEQVIERARVRRV